LVDVNKKDSYHLVGRSFALFNDRDSYAL